MFEVWSPHRIRGPPRYVAAADGNCSPRGTSQVALVVKNPLSNAEDIRDVDSIPGAGRSPGRRRQSTPVFLPGESHGHRSRAGYSPWGCRESDTTEVT